MRSKWAILQCRCRADRRGRDEAAVNLSWLRVRRPGLVLPDWTGKLSRLVGCDIWEAPWCLGLSCAPHAPSPRYLLCSRCVSNVVGSWGRGKIWQLVGSSGHVPRVGAGSLPVPSQPSAGSTAANEDFPLLFLHKARFYFLGDRIWSGA